MRILLLIFLFLSFPVYAQVAALEESRDIDIASILLQVPDPFVPKVPPPPEKPQEATALVNPDGSIAMYPPNLAAQIPEIIKIEKPNLSVEGLVWGDKIQQAIINGQVVGVGDTINDARIKSVSKNGVQVIYKNTDFLFTVP